MARLAGHKVWWLLLLGVSIIVTAISQGRLGAETFDIFRGAKIAGGVLAIFMVAGGLASIAQFLWWTAGRSMTSRQWISVFSVGVAIFVGLLIVNMTLDTTVAQESSEEATDTVFAPASSEYAVTFSGTPSIPSFSS